MEHRADSECPRRGSGWRRACPSGALRRAGPQRRREHVHESPAWAIWLRGSPNPAGDDQGAATFFRHRDRARRARPGLLSPSEQRLVTIASALAKSARLIILDEPTAALTESEAKRLYSHIRRVCAEGVACLYISHRLDEIEHIADRVVVMRNGRVVARFDEAKGKNREIVRAMIGRDPERSPARKTPETRSGSCAWRI